METISFSFSFGEEEKKKIIALISELGIPRGENSLSNLDEPA